MNRRALVRRLAGLAALLPLGRARLFAREAALSPGETASLRGLARTLLPASLGEARQAAVLAEFQNWIRGYRHGAELDHGYGFTKLRWSGASPAVRYPAQLAALEAAARERGASGFADLESEAQRELLETALAAAGVAELPERPDGRHVAADLAAFFFRSAAGSDLCYRARIAREDCRGLADSQEPPEPLEPESPA